MVEPNGLNVRAVGYFKRDLGSCRSEGEQDGEDQPCEADRPDDGVAAPGRPAGLYLVSVFDPLGHPALMPVMAPENKCPGGWRPFSTSSERKEAQPADFRRVVSGA
jgi:hypothetical protein